MQGTDSRGAREHCLKNRDKSEVLFAPTPKKRRKRARIRASQGGASRITRNQSPPQEDRVTMPQPIACVGASTQAKQTGEGYALVLNYDALKGEIHGFESEKERWPNNVCKLFAALTDKLNAVRGELPEIRWKRPSVLAAYHAFAAAYWKRRESEKRRPHFPIHKDDESCLILANKAAQNTHEALALSNKWENPDDDFPRYCTDGMQFSLGGVPQEDVFNEAMIQSFRNDLANLGLDASIIYMITMGAWIKAFHSETLASSGAVHIHVNDVLELRGYTKHKNGGFRREHKLEVAGCLHRLSRVNIKGQIVAPNGKRLYMKGAMLHVTEVGTDDLFGETPYEFLVRPGDAMLPLFQQRNATQFARFFTALAKLGTKKPGVQRYAALLGTYLFYHYRIRESKQNFAQPFYVRTLLEGAHIEIETNSSHFARFRQHIEDALDLIQSLGGVRAWEYASGNENDLPKRGWFPVWLDQWSIRITPPDSILADAALRSAGQKKAIAAAKKTRKKRP
jgi:hypothetical protein